MIKRQEVIGVISVYYWKHRRPHEPFRLLFRGRAIITGYFGKIGPIKDSQVYRFCMRPFFFHFDKMQLFCSFTCFLSLSACACVSPAKARGAYLSQIILLARRSNWRSRCSPYQVWPCTTYYPLTQTWFSRCSTRAFFCRIRMISDPLHTAVSACGFDKKSKGYLQRTNEKSVGLSF